MTAVAVYVLTVLTVTAGLLGHPSLTAPPEPLSARQSAPEALPRLTRPTNTRTSRRWAHSRSVPTHLEPAMTYQPTTPAPAIGQIWQDNDKRSYERYIRIVDLDASRATVRQVAYNPTDGTAVVLPGVRVTRIRLDRFRPTSTGYRYISPA